MENAATINNLKIQLRTAATVATFRCNPLAKFRIELQQCLHRVTVAVTSRRDGIVKVVEKSLLETLKALPWKELCEYHDQQESLTTKTSCSLSGGSGGKSTTPLEELITHLLDPRNLPRSCCILLVRLLLEALLESPRRATIPVVPNNVSSSTTRWTPSQLYLLQSIVTLWNTCPSLNQSFGAENLLYEESHLTPHKWNRLLSVVSHIAGDFPLAHSTMTHFLLSILARVDQMEIETETEGGAGEKNMAIPCTCCKADGWHSTVDDVILPSTHRRLKGVRMARLEDLHDSNISSTCYRPQYLPQRLKSGRGPSLKDVLSAKGRTTISSTVPCQCHNPSSQTTINASKRSLSQEWNLVRARAYKKFQALFQRQHPWPSSTSRRRTSISRLDMRGLLQLAHDEYHTPSIRLCLLLVAYQSRSPVQCNRLCQTAWRKYASTKDSLWLRIYSEMIVEWSCFDEREWCWKAFQPLVAHVLVHLGITERNGLQEEEGEDGPVEETVLPGRDIFQGLAYILSRRSTLFELEHDDIRKEFRSFVTVLEIHCGEVNIWFDPQQRLVLDEDCVTFRTLQLLGILGLASTLGCDEKDESIDEENTLGNSDKVLQEWPFSGPFCLRSAYDRVGNLGRSKLEDWNQLLASEGFGRFLESSGSSYINSPAGPPLTEFIENSDLLQQIFQYCVYQDVGKCREVCQEWKAVIDSSNSLWQDVYRNRFRVHPDDPRAKAPAPGTRPEDWKQLFVQKVLVERSLMHRRNQTSGWKHRTCAYLGCYHVLRSERLEASHFAAHARQAARKASAATSSKQPSTKKKKRFADQSGSIGHRKKKKSS